MALSNIEFVQIKEEYELMTDKITEEEETLFSSRTAQTKCGEIHAKNSSNFILICMLCEGEYDNLMVFGKHYQNKHVAPKLSDILEFKHEEPVMIDFPEQKSQANQKKELYSLNLSLPSATVYASTISTNAQNKNIDTYKDQQPTLERQSEKEPIKISGKRETTSDEYRSASSEFTRNRRNSESASKRTKSNSTSIPNEKSNDNMKRANDSLMEATSFFCEIYNQKFRYKKQLRRHEMYHDPPPLDLQCDPDYLKCYYCGIEFTELRDWRQHDENHGKAPPYACLICPQLFKSEDYLRYHMNSHNGLKPFKCEQCPLAFAHIVNFNQHVKRIHLKIARHECSLCKKKFVTRTELGIHKRIHTGEKPFQCNVCGTKFRFRCHMVEHRKKHDKLLDYKCNICPAAFFLKSSLKRHICGHHKLTVRN